MLTEETVEDLTDRLLYPLYPIQRELKDSLCAFLDMTENVEEFTKRCSTQVQYGVETRLKTIMASLGVDNIQYQHPFLPEKDISDKQFWLNLLWDKDKKEGTEYSEEDKQKILLGNALRCFPKLDAWLSRQV